MNIRNRFTRSAAVVACGFLVASAISSATQAQDAKQLYEKNCLACHGASGKGNGPASKVMKPPPSEFAVALKGKSDAEIAKVVKEGGKAVGRAASMPGYGSKLSDEQIQGVTQYIKSLK